MRKPLLLWILLVLSWNIYGLTLEDIIRLSQAQVEEEVILSIIKSSDTRWELRSDDIILLKNQGVSTKVILAIIDKSAPTPEKKRERTPFDEFFLSPYYSHEYGWPEPNYDSPREILESGLFYQPDSYPDARWMRIYGWDYTYDRRRQLWNSSPYSLLVPTRKRIYYKSAQAEREKELKPAEVPVAPEPPKTQESKAKSPQSSKTRAGLPVVGEWYQALEGAMDTLEAQLKSLRLSDTNPDVAEVATHIQKIRQYRDTLQTLQHRVPEQKRRNFGQWLTVKVKDTPYLEEQYSLYALKAIVTQGQLNLGVEDEVMEVILYTTDVQRDIKTGQLPEALLKNILARLTIIHHKFTDLYLRMDKALLEFESKSGK